VNHVWTWLVRGALRCALDGAPYNAAASGDASGGTAERVAPAHHRRVWRRGHKHRRHTRAAGQHWAGAWSFIGSSEAGRNFAAGSIVLGRMAARALYSACKIQGHNASPPLSGLAADPFCALSATVNAWRRAFRLLSPHAAFTTQALKWYLLAISPYGTVSIALEEPGAAVHQTI